MQDEDNVSDEYTYPINLNFAGTDANYDQITPIKNANKVLDVCTHNSGTRITIVI